MKRKSTKHDMCECCDGGWFGCCISYMGVVHVGIGAGVAFLIVEYTGLGNIGMWGWILLAVGAIGHFVGSMKCKHC